MQTNKAKGKALEVTFREHCLRARAGLISDDTPGLINKNPRSNNLVKKSGKGRGDNLVKK
jgi:hypothetical protein